MGARRRVPRSVVAAGLLTVVICILFSGLALAVSSHDGPLSIDQHVLNAVVAHRHSALNSLAKAVTTLGTSPIVYGTVLLCGFLTSQGRTRWAPLAFAVAALISGQLVRLAINEAIARPRPPQNFWLMHAGGYAFPSGHTTTATLGYFLAAALAGRSWPQRRTLLFALAVVLALAVGASRVYLGVHWATDVVGGWLFAAAWLGLCSLAYQLSVMSGGATDRGLRRRLLSCDRPAAGGGAGHRAPQQDRGDYGTHDPDAEQDY